jgi:hypothetical protein
MAQVAEVKLRRLYDAIENGVADLSDPDGEEPHCELKAIRDQARVGAERAQDAIVRPADADGLRTVDTVEITFACLPSASKATRKTFASWRRKAYCRARCATKVGSTTRACRVKKSGYPGAGFAAPGPCGPTGALGMIPEGLA